jgi:hypothetical protein
MVTEEEYLILKDMYSDPALRESDYRGVGSDLYVEDVDYRTLPLLERLAYEAQLAGGTPLELWLRSLRPTLLSVTNPVGDAIGGLFGGFLAEIGKVFTSGIKIVIVGGVIIIGAYGAIKIISHAATRSPKKATGAR